ncbi:MAG: D-glycero-beta-D-manno-heptose 1-phosphate adenylyltransferase [Planctomycetes bacterium]|nr:D-glycero-beta-D-manno-heptose 1-phosphate adenylyltransferase [Planctomycetota bacterium]
MTDLIHTLNALDSPRLLVLGDLVLDRYTWAEAERVSPEAPALVLRAEGQEVRPGGAAGVAYLLRALGAQVSLAGLVGDDAGGRVLRHLLEEAAVDQGAVLSDPDRPTTTKERFLGQVAHRYPHQLFRVDHEVRRPPGPALEEDLTEAVTSRLVTHDALLVADYAKGVCTPALLKSILPVAARYGIPVLIDPARLSDYGRYRGASLLTPNRREAELATGRAIGTLEEALEAGRRLAEKDPAATVLLKLDRDGLALVQPGKPGQWFSTRPRPVCDVTGAGDMVLAMAGLCRAAGLSWEDTARLANVAAGLEVEKLGLAPVTRAEIRTELGRAERTSRGKRVTLEEMVALAENYRQARRTVVFTNGCFDLLHIGHVSLLEEAARRGDVLVVAINSDQSVRRLKGPGRPVLPEENRAALVAALGSVDHVLIFEEDTPHTLLEQIRPHVLVKGGTYTREQVVGREVVEGYGGRVHLARVVEDVSTTRLLEALRGPAPSPDL